MHTSKELEQLQDVSDNQAVALKSQIETDREVCKIENDYRDDFLKNESLFMNESFLRIRVCYLAKIKKVENNKK